MGLVAAAEWLGKPYRLCRVDMMGEMRAPDYARINPRRETPVLITEGGRVLTETLAIAWWLEARDAERRVSYEPLSPEADRMHQFMAFVNTGFTAAFGPLWAAFELDNPEPPYREALRRFGSESVIERHDKLEEMIGGTAYLVGERPSLADAVLVGVARWLDFHTVADAERWPRLAAWRRRIDADHAVRFATALEAGERPQREGALRGHIELSEVVRQFGS
jgi:glutathione S-transferase